MNTEQITQLVETIKTLNLNIDSESAVQIVEEIKPLVWAFLIKDIIGELAFPIIILGTIYMIIKTFKWAGEKGYLSD